MLLNHLRTIVDEYRTRVPFDPFFIELVSGERILVRHPESLSISQRGLAYYIDSNSDVQQFDHESVSRIMDYPLNENGQPDPVGAATDA